jgi:hypothetical protein
VAYAWVLELVGSVHADEVGGRCSGLGALSFILANNVEEVGHGRILFIPAEHEIDPICFKMPEIGR